MWIITEDKILSVRGIRIVFVSDLLIVMWSEVTLEKKTRRLATYHPKFNSPFVFVSIMVLEYSRVHFFTYCLYLFHFPMAKLSSWNRNHKVHKAKYIYYLSLYRKSLPTLILNQRDCQYHERYLGKHLETMRKLWTSNKLIEPCCSGCTTAHNIFSEQ